MNIALLALPVTEQEFAIVMAGLSMLGAYNVLPGFDDMLESLYQRVLDAGKDVGFEIPEEAL